MRLTGKRLPLGPDGRRSNPWRMLVYILLIAGGILILRLNQSGQVQPLFLPTAGPTRSARSFAEEAEIHFSVGDLEKAIASYRSATTLEPQQPEFWYRLARIQTYSSAVLTPLSARQGRLAEARESIEKALEADPENVIAHAMRALVYDWSATAEIRDQITVGDLVRVQGLLDQGGEITARIIEAVEPLTVPGGAEGTESGATLTFSGEVESIRTDEWRISGRTVQVTSTTLIRRPNRREEFFTEAERSAERALQIEPGNILALAFNAEVLVDQQSFAEAFDLAGKAANALNELGDDYDFALDIHRVYGTVLENQALYLQAILEYEKARQINPNLTFLHLSIGANYRQLRDIDRALYYFDMAADINQQHEVKDPTPYLAIGKTYQQQGEFFIAAINIERALAIDPYNPDIFGRLGIVYFQARNYESAIDILRCATRGCSIAETQDRICRFVYRLDSDCDEAQVLDQEVVGLELGPNSVEYYYTYGSVLAAYNGHADYPRICIEAEEIFSELTTQYGNDPLVAAIIAEGRAICGSAGTVPETIPTSTPIPDESS